MTEYFVFCLPTIAYSFVTKTTDQKITAFILKTNILFLSIRSVFYELLVIDSKNNKLYLNSQYKIHLICSHVYQYENSLEFFILQSLLKLKYFNSPLFPYSLHDGEMPMSCKSSEIRCNNAVMHILRTGLW